MSRIDNDSATSIPGATASVWAPTAPPPALATPEDQHQDLTDEPSTGTPVMANGDNNYNNENYYNENGYNENNCNDENYYTEHQYLYDRSYVATIWNLIQDFDWRTPVGAHAVTLCMSVLAMTIGLTLLIVSEPWADHPGPALPPPKNLLNLTSGAEYWKVLHDSVRPPTMIKNPHSMFNDTLAAEVLLAAPPLRRGTPQWKALDWMVRFDPLAPLSSLPSHRLTQRYALAVLYFTWNGASTWAFTTPKDGWFQFVTQATGPNHTVLWVGVPDDDADEEIATSNNDDEQTDDHTHFWEDTDAIKGDQNVLEPAQQGLTPVPLHECDWLGVTCNDQEQIVEVNFGSSTFELTGRVPTELGLLSHLQKLDCSSQSLSGHFHAFPQLSSLTSIDLSDNQLTGLLSMNDHKSSRVDTLGKNGNLMVWPKMRDFRVNNNDLKGRMPDLSHWTQLQHWDASLNRELNGPLWQESVVYWPKLTSLQVEGTGLSGSIPEVVTPGGTLSQIKVLAMEKSDFTGTLPVSLAKASNLKSFRVGDPKGVGLTPGQLPTEYGVLTNLRDFIIRNTRGVKGTLPSEFGLWSNVVNLFVEEKGLTGTIPTELGQLTNLMHAIFQGTSLTGTIPSELGLCTLLSTMYLHSSKLVGTMPEELCALKMDKLTSDCRDSVGFDGQVGTNPNVVCECCTDCHCF